MGWVVISLVWKHLATLARFCMMHWMSTTMASQAPVTMASSCCRKVPHRGTPWRCRISLAVQQIPDSWMPLAPFSLA
jgi:hypothetical protein